MYIHMWNTHDMCIQTWILHIFHSLSLSIYVSLCLCIYLNTRLPKPHLQISYSCLFLCHYYPFEIHLYLDSFHFRIFFPLFLIFFFMSIWNITIVPKIWTIQKGIFWDLSLTVLSLRCPTLPSYLLCSLSPLEGMVSLVPGYSFLCLPVQINRYMYIFLFIFYNIQSIILQIFFYNFSTSKYVLISMPCQFIVISSFFITACCISCYVFTVCGAIVFAVCLWGMAHRGLFSNYSLVEAADC